MEVALLYRWAVFILLSVGLVLLMKHGILTPFVFWSRIQYYTFSTFTLFFVWLAMTLFKADVPYLYTADCRYIVAAGLVTLSVMYHIIVRPGAIKTHRLNDISYEHFSFYNYIFHYFIPVLMTADYLFFVDKTELHWYLFMDDLSRVVCGFRILACMDYHCYPRAVPFVSLYLYGSPDQ